MAFAQRLQRFRVDARYRLRQQAQLLEEPCAIRWGEHRGRSDGRLAPVLTSGEDCSSLSRKFIGKFPNRPRNMAPQVCHILISPLLRKWPLSYSFFRVAWGHFPPSLSG